MVLTCDHHRLGANQGFSGDKDLARPFPVVLSVGRVHYDAALVAMSVLGFAIGVIHAAAVHILNLK